MPIIIIMVIFMLTTTTVQSITLLLAHVHGVKVITNLTARVYFKGGQGGAFAPPGNLVAPPRNLLVLKILLKRVHNIITKW